MNTSLSSVSLLLALLLAGCAPTSEEPPALATIVVGPEYRAGKGLFLPDDTRQSLGLKVVEVGEQKVATRVDLSLRLYAEAGEVLRASGMATAEQAAVLKIGQRVTLDADGGEPRVGAIKSLGGPLPKVSGLVEVIAEFPKSAGLTAGSFVTATATQEGAAVVATVPRSALVQTTEGDFVYTESGRHFVRTAVKLGARNAEVAEIKEGLYAGDRVVAESAMALWMTELAAIKGGQACCAVPARRK